jgi:hypothetical protein
MTSFFKIKGRSILPEAWGDYADILQHGMTAHSQREDGNLSLERTGPFIPPITLPGINDIILTSVARELLESSGLTGFTFIPVKKKLIVELRWETWDLNDEEPREMPDSGEPEDYILGKPHCRTAARELGDLWEVSISSATEAGQVSGPRIDQRQLDLSTGTVQTSSEPILRAGARSSLQNERCNGFLSVGENTCNSKLFGPRRAVSTLS